MITINRIKTSIIFACVVLLPLFCSGQFSEFSNSNFKRINYLEFQPQVNVTLLKGQNFRHGALWYHPIMFKGEHVISVVQPNNIFDTTYFLDEKGDVKYRSMAVTAPMNRYFSARQFDSYNPYGASTIGESISQGLLNMLFNRIKL